MSLLFGCFQLNFLLLFFFSAFFSPKKGEKGRKEDRMYVCM